MLARRTYKTQQNEKGLVLLVLVIIIVFAFVTYSFSGISITKIHIDQSKNTAVALKQAKQAIINYAITYSDRGVGNDYGVFPHPETKKNGAYGNMPGNVGTQNTNAIGWLPWRSLDLPALKDDSGTCLFYAVSGTYKLGGSVQADMINEDSIGMFQVVDSAIPPAVPNVLKGAFIEDRVVALVIAPGEALSGQTRNQLVVSSNCGHDYENVSAYLEGDSSTDNSLISNIEETIDQFIHSSDSSKNENPAYNDKFLTITRDEIWNAIVKRDDFKNDMESLTQALATCLANYANHALNNGRRLPWATKVSLGGPLSYRDNMSYVDDPASEGYSGRYPFDVGSSNAAIDPVNMVEDNLFEIPGLCGAGDLGDDWKGDPMNLAVNTSKYGQLWNNWKDHFFYILSKSYEPENTGTKANCEAVGAACVKVNATEYAGAVIFSGSRLTGVTRLYKYKISEYLEDGKATVFNDEKVNKTGAETYVYTDLDAIPPPDPEVVNDIMYCIENNTDSTPLIVNECL